MKSLLFSFLTLIASASFGSSYDFNPPVPLSEMERNNEIIDIMNSVAKLNLLEETTFQHRRKQILSEKNREIAQNFIDVAEVFCSWVNNDAVLYSYGIPCAVEKDLLHATINKSNLSPRLLPTTGDVVDNHGVTKDVVTDMTERTLTINIPRWETASLQQRAMTAAMEMSLLIGIPERYSVAQRFIDEVNHPKAASQNECDRVTRVLTKVLSASSDMIRSCYNLVQNHQVESQNFKDDKIFSEHVETLFPFVAQYCDQVCHQSFCHAVEVEPGSSCRTKY